MENYCKICKSQLASSIRGADKHRYTPNLIKGDLDSLREDVREYYATKARCSRLCGSPDLTAD